jgi:hypothetical protein
MRTAEKLLCPVPQQFFMAFNADRRFADGRN